MVKQVTALESWSVIPLGSSGSQSKTHTSEIAHPKGKRVGISMRLLLLLLLLLRHFSHV